MQENLYLECWKEIWRRGYLHVRRSIILGSRNMQIQEKQSLIRHAT